MIKNLGLFDIIPDKYFQLFQGKNKRIYATSLLLLYKVAKDNETFINKSDFLNVLKDKATNEIEKFTYSDEEFETIGDDALLYETLNEKASFVLKRLEETGWIEIAMDTETMEEIIILPSYSMNILDSFSSIISDEESPYISLVHSTYADLSLEDQEQDEFMYTALHRAFENTKKLKIELISLINNIRIFKNKLTKIFEANDVIKDYFDSYKNKIIDKYYHPLKTFDSVSKFKRPIIKILDNWLSSKEIRQKLALQAGLLNGNIDRKSLENRVITEINYISDTYESISNLINSIDKENNLYTKSSTNKILFLNNTDKTISGHLDNIFKFYAKNIANNRNLAKVLSSMQDSLYFYENGFIDNDSLTLPILRKIRDDDTPLEIYDLNFIDDTIMQNFLEETKNNFSDERINEFMLNAFGSEHEVFSGEIPLINFDAFVLLILATLKRDDPDAFYEVDFVDESKVFNHDYIIPNIKFIRKEGKENV